jgi:hypothetical protein
VVVGASADREGRRRCVTAHRRASALSQDPEPVNPRVGAGECWVPFPDFDEVRSDNGGPR